MPLNYREKFALLGAGAAIFYGFWRVLRHQEQLAKSLQERIDAHEEQMLYRHIESTRHVQALLWLQQQLADDEIPLPLMRGWAISPDFAAYWVTILRTLKPRYVVELGGGTSTLITAKILAQLGNDGRVIAVEMGEKYAADTRAQIERHGLSHIAQVIHAPQTTLRLEEASWSWYSLNALLDLPQIDLLLVDGPAQFRNPAPMVRYPALPLLYGKLKAGAHIVLDDSNRDSEQQILARWQREYPALRLIEERADLEKGATLLQLSAKSAHTKKDIPTP